MKSLRNPKSEEVYQRDKAKQIGCPFCVESSNDRLWRVQPANYPYDAVYSIHDLLLPSRHVSSIDELTPSEAKALQERIDYYNSIKEYDSIMFNFKHKQTQPQHLHFHLLSL